MGIKKEVKEKIIQLMLQEVPTEEIAKKLNYSIGTVRNIFEDLRDEYGVNSKIGIATAYLRHEISKLNELSCHILNITNFINQPETRSQSEQNAKSYQMITTQKPALQGEKRQSQNKNKKFKK